jgi:hypothetical protein
MQAEVSALHVTAYLVEQAHAISALIVLPPRSSDAAIVECDRPAIAVERAPALHMVSVEVSNVLPQITILTRSSHFLRS